MAITIDWNTFVIFVPQADLTPISGNLYEIDVDSFRLELKSIEDSDEGITFPDTHRHQTETTLSGITFARIVEILPPYTVEFEDGQYVVQAIGANHNLADVKVANQVSLISQNSAGLINAEKLVDIWKRLSLDSTDPFTVTPSQMSTQSGDIVIDITGDGKTTSTGTRQ